MVSRLRLPTIAVRKFTEKSRATTFHQCIFRGAELRHLTCEVQTDRNSTWKEPSGVDCGVTVYNSLNRSHCKLIVPPSRALRWYACGPTVYDEAHIGHASTYVRLDIVRRILTTFFNTDVVYVLGITDVDDKIIGKAKELHTDVRAVAQHYENKFFSSMAKLRVWQPTIIARVSTNIPTIVSFVSKIVEKGRAYPTVTGDVYFSVPQCKSYGKFVPPASSEFALDSGGSSLKRDPRDFALWKSAKPGEPSWESPWGRGRPGWHIECSALASQIFGGQLDIHSGGTDLIFPHHENELAQSETYHDCSQWAHYWLHTGLLHASGDMNKMSKSLRNFVTVDQMLEHYSAGHFRIFCLLSPYRNKMEYSDETMKAAVRMHKQIDSFLSTADQYIIGQWTCSPINEIMLASSLQSTRERVREALCDDFNTPRAMQALMALVHVGNIELNRCGPSVTAAKQSGPRCPGLVAGIVLYVRRTMDMFGVSFTSKQMAGVPDHVQNAEQCSPVANVLDATLKFRDSVRAFALSKEPAGDADREARKRKMQERQILLTACDSLRDDLESSCGVRIKDRGDRSSWELSSGQPQNRTSGKTTDGKESG